jgi:hypothetical protein
VLEFRAAGVSDRIIADVKELEHYWACQAESGGDCRGRLYVLEDLSATYIEALGGRFGIDPLLFATHLYAPVWNKAEGDRVSQGLHSRLISTRRLDPTIYSLRYYEVPHFTQTPMGWNRQKFTCANVSRRILTVDPEYGDIYGFILRSASFWVPTATSHCWDGELYITLTTAVYTIANSV